MSKSIETGASTSFPNKRQVKYQYIKLMKSGRSMRETKSLFRSVAASLMKEYVSKKDLMDLLSLEGGFNRISMTRGQAVDVAKIKFAPRKIQNARAEEILAKFIIGYRGRIPHDWKRDGNLIRRGRPNKTRPGSSRGKIGKTRVIGAAKVLKDFRHLIRTLQRLQGKHGKTDMRTLQKAYKAVRIQATPKV